MEQEVKNPESQADAGKRGEPPVITVSRKNPDYQNGDDIKSKYVQDMALWSKKDKEGKEHFEGYVRNAAGEKKQIVAFFRKDAGQEVEGGGSIPVLTIKEDVKKGEEGKFVGAAWPINSRADGSTTDVDFSTLYLRFDEQDYKPNEKGVAYAHVWTNHTNFGFHEAPRPVDAKPEAAGPAEDAPTPVRPARAASGPGR
ncbi:MAG: hypothetical protein M1608_11865 [Candidatus Omnitrophica bacterium]|nr:hypothetical protein [Candidatus Omnitrophota bacterium]